MKTKYLLLCFFVYFLFSAEVLAAQCGPTYGADGIAVDSKGAVWITHYEDVRVGRLNPEGNEFTEFLPTTKANQEVTTRVEGSSKEGFDYSLDTGFDGIAVDDKRGFLWTGKWNSNKVVRFSLKDGGFKEITLPAKYIFGCRGNINMDTEGNIWVFTIDNNLFDTGVKDGKIMKVSPDGKVKGFSIPVKEFTGKSMTLDSQGRPWVALTPVEKGKDALVYAFIKGKWQMQKLPNVGRYITSMAFDSKGNLWLSAFEINAIVRISPGGETKFYSIPTAKAGPGEIKIDGRDNIWFTEWEAHKIGRLSPDGQLKEYQIPHEEVSPVTIAFDNTSNVWFSTLLNYNLFRLDPATGAIKEYTVPAPSNWSEDAAATSSVCRVGSKDTTIEEAKADPLVPLRRPKGYPDARAALFEKSCNTACHTWYRVDKAAHRRSDWTATVDRMIEGNGARFITEKDRKEIIEYLNTNYTMKGRLVGEAHPTVRETSE